MLDMFRNGNTYVKVGAGKGILLHIWDDRYLFPCRS